MIVLNGVSKSFDRGRTYAVRELSLHVEDGETLVFLGSSGCGKTTTLKMINRLIEPTSGKIEVDGKDVTLQDRVTLRRSIGYVFQGIGLFPHYRVAQNVEIVPKLLNWPAKVRRKRVHEVLDLVGLPFAEYGQRFPDELSGGQQQRIGVARALAADPKYLLMDEPFGALDAISRDSLQQELKSLTKRLGKTIVFVTHDIFEALALADRIAIFHAGRMQQIDTPQNVLSAPATPFVRELFEKPARQLAAYQESR
ncbi:MAG: ATP-binding cassette domain-containing protein [Planctomycetota bacterium]|nr:ATP-binding cassette domain-containing protein [Planctomycetota bacterium]MDA1211304.1 ATP-binding cassette domain-containing protein [Planctomycetota bacterium]